MTGTSFSHTREIDLMPPRMTIATSATTTMPTSHCGMAAPSMSDVLYSASASEFDWVEAPMPNAASDANRANSTASTRPSFLFLKPRSSAYIAPPSILPEWSFTRYFTPMNTSEYLVAMPRMPVIHIQKMAPGPPNRRPVPTPTMLPVPMVAASAVVSAPNWVMSPSASDGSSLVTDSLMPVPSLRWMNPVRIVMKMCVPSRSKIMMGPHTKPSTASITSSGLVAAAKPSPKLVNGVMKNDVRKSSIALPFPRESACIREP